MHPLEVYYRRHAGRGSDNTDTGIVPIYSSPSFVQRGHGIGHSFGSLFRSLKPILWSGAKALGRGSLRTGGKILSVIAENRSPEVSVGDIVSRHMTESTQDLIDKLRGRGRKRTRARTSQNKRKTNKRDKVTKSDIS